MRTCVVFSAMQKFPTFDGIVLFLPWSVSNTGQLPWPSDQFPGRRGQRLGPENKEKNEQETSNPSRIVYIQNKQKQNQESYSYLYTGSSRLWTFPVCTPLKYDANFLLTSLRSKQPTPTLMYQSSCSLLISIWFFFSDQSRRGFIFSADHVTLSSFRRDSISMRQMQIKE